jgi:polysaccharide biosynthesis transport protein
MNGLTPVGVDASREVAPSPGVPGFTGSPRWNPSRDDARPRGRWQSVSHNVALIALCGIIAGGARFLVTARQPPLFESSVSIRVDPKPGSPTSQTAVPTELEMLRSRALARQVVDSTAFRLQVTGSNTTERVRPPRSSIMTDIRVDSGATPNLYRLTRATGNDLELWRATDQELIATVSAGGVVRLHGLSFRLSPEIVSLAPVDFAVLTLDDAVDSVQAWTNVTRRGRDADLLDLRVRGRDPVLVYDIADAFGRLYIASRGDTYPLEAQHSVEFLRDQVARASRQLGSAERALRDYRARAGVASVPDAATTGLRHRADLIAQRNAANVEREALKRLIRAASSGSKASNFRDLLAFPALLRSEAAVTLQAALIGAEQRRTELLLRGTERDNDVKVLNARIAELRKQLRGLATASLQGLTNQVQALNAILARSGKDLATVPEKELHQAELEHAVTNSASLSAMLHERLRQAELGAAATDEQVQLVDAAVLPRRPVSSDSLRSILLAIAAGLTTGLAFALLRQLRNLRDLSVRTRAQLLAATDSPVLSLIPRIHGPRGKQSHAPTHPADSSPRPRYAINDLSSFGESFTRLVMNLGFASHAQPIKVVLVTSALPGDGKTTVATNLSLTLAREGKRVLLIDGDLRDGQIGGMMRLPSASGFNEALKSQTDLGQSVSQVFAGERCTLHVLSRGRSTVADPAGALSSDALTELLAHAREIYDMIVIDSPPVNSVADAALLSRHCDGVVVVARAGTTAPDALKFAMEQLRIARAPVIGAVLNDVDLRRDSGADAAHQYYGRHPSSAPA